MKMTAKRKYTMHILFTADENYARRIPTVLESIKSSHPEEEIHIHLISDELSEELKDFLSKICSDLGYDFCLYRVLENAFADAPVNKHYSKAMYYRMLAAEILPQDVERVLYLDPDILVIGSLMPLWGMDLEADICFAAASHTTEQGILDNINRLRLETSSVYYNTGVLLMDLKKCRRQVRRNDIFSFINDNEFKLLLPDQDVFNALYGKLTKKVPDEIWNYDARKYSKYLMKSAGAFDEYWVIRNTAVLHYCGKDKPWNPSYRFRFGNLYRHYQQLSERRGIGIRKDMTIPEERRS